MNNNAPSMLKATAIGGLVLGVVGGIPFLNMINCACCALVIGAGFLASFLYSRECQSVGAPFRPGNGAVVGLVAGLFYAIATSVVGGIFSMIFPTDPEDVMEMIEQFGLDPEQAEAAERMAEMFGGGGGMGAIVIGFFVSLIVAAIFSTVGGLIGGAVFKYEPPIPPAAPPAMSGGGSAQPPSSSPPPIEPGGTGTPGAG